MNKALLVPRGVVCASCGYKSSVPLVKHHWKVHREREFDASRLRFVITRKITGIRLQSVNQTRQLQLLVVKTVQTKRCYITHSCCQNEPYPPTLFLPGSPINLLFTRKKLLYSRLLLVANSLCKGFISKLLTASFNIDAETINCLISIYYSFYLEITLVYLKYGTKIVQIYVDQVNSMPLFEIICPSGLDNLINNICWIQNCLVCLFAMHLGGIRLYCKNRFIAISL